MIPGVRVMDTRGIDLAELDASFLENGRVRCLPAASFRAIGTERFFVWCARRALYALPTLELVEWLRGFGAGHRILEIGAGNGELGRHVGDVVQTDSFQQQRTPAFYLAQGHAPTSPHAIDVVKLEAREAVRRYRPDVVIASWVTELGNTPGLNSSEGVDEEAILDTGCTYVLIGNVGVHGRKRIMARPHSTLDVSWIVSRSLKPELNRIWIWGPHR